MKIKILESNKIQFTKILFIRKYLDRLGIYIFFIKIDVLPLMNI